MATQNIDLVQISTVELKALAYDLNMLIGRSQQNLQLVIKELDKRNSTPIESTPVLQS